jgi:TRAP-type C4-dicarboxylate transport system permease small subunit
MKRTLAGGTYRGPAELRRQRRALRTVQAILVLLATGLLLFAGYTWGRSSGLDARRQARGFDAPSRPSSVQTAALALLGGVAFAAAVALQGDGVRLPTPARLEELTGRAEAEAVERAERVAAGRSG